MVLSVSMAGPFRVPHSERAQWLLGGSGLINEPPPRQREIGKLSVSSF